MDAAKIHQKASPKKGPAKSTAIVAMRQAGMTLRDIGNQTGLTPSGIWRHLKRVTPEMIEYNAQKSKLADHFAIAALDNLNLSSKITKILTEMPEDQMKVINPVNLAAIKRTADVGIGIAHDHYRLESGQSTTNISALIGSIEQLQRDRSGAATQQLADNNSADSK
jgi:IS30 family transposase